MITIETRFIDAPRIKRQLYASGRVKYVAINRATTADPDSTNWTITKYSDEDIPTDQQTLENISYTNVDSAGWAF